MYRAIGITLGVSVVIVAIVFAYNDGMCSGEREWSTYTGILEYIEVDTSQCCHVRSGFKLTGQHYVRVYNWDESLLDIPFNETYTFYLEPFREPNAVSVGCFWVQVIYRVTDINGHTVWQSRWW
jgi:hypothetical protein